MTSYRFIGGPLDGSTEVLADTSERFRSLDVLSPAPYHYRETVYRKMRFAYDGGSFSYRESCYVAESLSDSEAEQAFTALGPRDWRQV